MKKRIAFAAALLLSLTACVRGGDTRAAQTPPTPSAPTIHERTEELHPSGRALFDAADAVWRLK